MRSASLRRRPCVGGRAPSGKALQDCPAAARPSGLRRHWAWRAHLLEPNGHRRSVVYHAERLANSRRARGAGCGRQVVEHFVFWRKHSLLLLRRFSCYGYGGKRAAKPQSAGSRTRFSLSEHQIFSFSLLAGSLGRRLVSRRTASSASTIVRNIRARSGKASAIMAPRSPII
jgi:hypothetical protein